METEFLNGDRTLRLGRIYGPKTRNYCFHFFRSGVRIGMVYYHHGAKQLVVNPCEIALTKETLIGLGQYLDMSVFRRQRRIGMSRIRRTQVKSRMEDTK